MSKTRAFFLDHQLSFADLSGDSNPLHIDPLVARRTLYGRPIVHGIHLVLWALGELLPSRCRLTKIVTNFSSPVGVDEIATCSVTKADAGAMELAVESREARCAVIKVSFITDGGQPDTDIVLVSEAPRSSCKFISPAELAGSTGQLVLALNKEKCDVLLASVRHKLPDYQIATLLATTRLVGMECPGLNSIYSQLNLEFTPLVAAEQVSLSWQVDTFDERFSRTTLKISAPGCTGSIAAFLRPTSPVQPLFNQVLQQVPAGCFTGQNALVIGGSRGTGEICMKILAAGGADVRLTYKLGSKEAGKLVQEIQEAGGTVSAFALDVMQPAPLEQHLQDWFPTHVYYFPTPAIFVGSKGKYSHEIFKTFYEVYVKGLSNIYNQLRKISKAKLGIFYPSSVVLDDPQTNMGEYAAAKAAGETFCQFLAVSDRNLSIRIIRLPRIITDQTASVVNVESKSALELLIPILVSPQYDASVRKP